MLKSTKLLQYQLQTDLTHDDIVHEDEDSEEGEELENVLPVNLDDISNLLTADSSTLINCVRCAEHTLQLVVTDALREQNLSKNMSECRRLAIALRKINNFTKLQLQKLPKPKLNVPTRWNSSYDMCERLLLLKEFCTNQREHDNELHVQEEIWNFMTEFVDIFRPIKIASLQLQESQMILGDFFKLWLCLKLEIQKKVSAMAVSLLNIIKKREKLLLESSVLLAALYLDPRFKFLLSAEENIKARKHLLQLSEHLFAIDTSGGSSDLISQSSSPTPSSSSLNFSSEDDDLMNYLNARETEQAPHTTNERERIDLEINNYAPDRIRDHTVNILTYWKIQSEKYPMLSKLAKIVHGVPATQVSVERSFSALKLILSNERNRLSSDNLENILMVKLNHHNFS